MAMTKAYYKLFNRTLILRCPSIHHESKHFWPISPNVMIKSLQKLMFHKYFRLSVVSKCHQYRCFKTSRDCFKKSHAIFNKYEHNKYFTFILHTEQSRTFASFNCLQTPAFNVSMLNIRRYHTPFKFTIQNSVYMSYLENLLKEYKTLHSDMPNQNSKVEGKPHQEHLLRLSFLRSVIEVIETLITKQAEVKEISSLVNGEEDKEMKKMLEKEMGKYMDEINELEEKLIDVLVGEDAADNSDIVLEVTGGVGGQESMLFCADIYNMYYNYAVGKDWLVTEIFSDKSEIGGIRKAAMEVSGQYVYRHFKHEGGVHRVQRVPKTEKTGRVHTSTISVSVLPQPREIDIDIQQKDLKIDTFRSSGPGGQSVNTTDSAVRITHIPTGTVSESRQERSQIKNKDIAMKNLKNKIYQVVLEEQELKRRESRKMQIGTRARSEKIRTYNFQQDRVTDHRLKENCSNLIDFMTGGEGLDNLINSLNRQDKLQTLESMLEEYEAEQSQTKSWKK